MHGWQLDAIGTAWQVDTAEPLSASVRREVLDRVETFDRTWSRFREDSLIMQMSERAGRWKLPAEAEQLLGFYAELHDVTGGAVDPLVGQALAELGYDATYSLTPLGTPTYAAGDQGWWATAWDERAKAASGPTVTTRQPVLLDVGAAGKGLLVDEVSSIVGGPHARFTVDASGDLYHEGAAPIRVAMEHPADPTRAIGIVEVGPGQALAASATNRRAWGDGLHHVLDARTGRPTADVIATWVVAAGSCMRADGLATAHFFAEPSRLMARFRHHYVRMHADGRVEWSSDFPGEVFA
ncbi:MAG: FAD:protein transferase [Aeromicrobium sp.]|nr:FAD:protein transferase [Aeromicrobium sp.]